MKLNSVLVITTYWLIIVLPTSVMAFDSELWPGEGRPQFQAKDSLVIFVFPNSDSPAIPGVRFEKGSEIKFVKTLYRTLEPGRVEIADPICIQAGILGEIELLTRKHYYGDREMVLLGIEPYDHVEYLQYRAEGWHIIRVNGIVYDVEDRDGWLGNRTDPELEWWVKIPIDSVGTAGWILIDEQRVELLPRRF